MIEEFIEKQKGGKDFLEIMKSGQTSDRHRVKFINYLADYVISIYSIQPTTAKMLNVAIPASEMFPVLMLSPVSKLKLKLNHMKNRIFHYARMF